MNTEELRRSLMGLVRVGTVMDVDSTKKRARVKFASEGFTSGWLYVIQRSGGGVYVPDAGSHNHGQKVSTNGSHSHGGQVSTDGSHDHSITTQPDHTHEGTKTTSWMPKVNDNVLCLYVPTDDGNGDGYILGGV